MTSPCPCPTLPYPIHPQMLLMPLLFPTPNVTTPPFPNTLLLYPTLIPYPPTLSLTVSYPPTLPLYPIPLYYPSELPTLPTAFSLYLAPYPTPLLCPPTLIPHSSCYLSGWPTLPTALNACDSASSTSAPYQKPTSSAPSWVPRNPCRFS